MSDRFLVDVEKLARLARELERAEEQLRNAVNTIKGGAGGDHGSPALTSACADFADRCEYGFGKIAESAQRMADRLRLVARNYQAVEQAVEKVFDGLRDLPAPTGPVILPTAGDGGIGAAATGRSVTGIGEALGGGR